MDVMAPDVSLGAPPVSYDEYVTWPESEVSTEVVDGRLIVNPNAASPHQFAATELAVALHGAVPRELVVLCPASDWVLRRDPLLVRQPDVVVVPREQARTTRMETPPPLAAEVVSPTSGERDLVTKRREYAQAGLPWYVLVSLDGPQILVLRNTGGTFVEHASARGDETLALTEPFGLTIRPRDLQV